MKSSFTALLVILLPLSLISCNYARPYSIANDIEDGLLKQNQTVMSYCDSVEAMATRIQDEQLRDSIIEYIRSIYYYIEDDEENVCSNLEALQDYFLSY